MKPAHLTSENFSSENFSGSSEMMSKARTAHSGIELVSSVPNKPLATALASSLLCDHTKIIENQFGSQKDNFSISLKRV